MNRFVVLIDRMGFLAMRKNGLQSRAWVLGICLPLLAMSQAVVAENWAHWRGPTGNGTSLTAKPPTQWNATKGIRWKVAIPGASSASPVVWDDSVFAVTSVATADDPQKLDFELHCYDRSSGELRWKKTAISAQPHEGTHGTNTFASASPCTDGEHIYAHFGSRGLYCYTMDGSLVWNRDFGKMRARNGFGEGSSPTIAGDRILVPWDHEGPSALYALDKKTGEIVWSKERESATCWATPLVIEHDGMLQAIMNGEGIARAYNVANGDELWSCPGQTARPAASAVGSGDVVYVGSGFRGSFMGAFRLGGKGNIDNTANVLWTIEEHTPDIGSPLLSDNRLYFYSGKSGLLTCVNATTGKPFYSTVRLPGFSTTYASPIAAGGHVYLSDRSGKMVIIKDAASFEVVAEHDFSETLDATPAAADNELFVRTAGHLYCIAP
jgi:outer membrane protein assembly factor BamB